MRPDRRGLGVAAAGVCAMLNMYTPQSVLPQLAAGFHVSPLRTGWTITATLLAVAVTAPFAGSFSDRVGRKRLIVSTAYLLAGAALLIPTAPTLPAMLAWRFLEGLLLPCVFAVAVAYIGEECPGAEGIRVTGIYTLGAILGGFGGRFIAGTVTDLAGWRAGFLAVGLATLAAATAVALLLPPERRFQPVRSLRGTLEGLAANATDRRLLAADAVGFAMLFSNVAVFTYANFYLADPPFRLGPAALGAIFAVYLPGVVTTPLSSRIAMRIGRRYAVMLCVPLAWAGLALTLLPSLPAIIAGLAIMASCIFVEQALSLGFVGASARRARSTAVGLYVTCFYIGGSLGGILPAGIWHHAGWAGCMGLVALVQGCILPIAFLFWRDERRAA